MKKNIKVLLGFLLTLTLLVGCGNQEANEEDPSTDNDTEEVVETDDGEETAEKDEAEETEAEDLEGKVVFEYLPEAEDVVDAKLTGHEEASEGQMEKAVYTIEDADAEKVMIDYKQKLEDEGWEVTEDNSPELIRVTKDDKEAIVTVGQNEEDVTLTILSN